MTEKNQEYKNLKNPFDLTINLKKKTFFLTYIKAMNDFLRRFAIFYLYLLQCDICKFITEKIDTIIAYTFLITLKKYFQHKF